MKRIFIASMLLAVFALAACSAHAAAAVRQEYENFSVDLPDGWTAQKLEELEYEPMVFANADGSAAAVILVGNGGKATSEDYVENLRKQYDGSTEAKENGDGFYTFSYNDDGVVCRVLAGVKEGTMMALIVMGDDPDLITLAASVRVKIQFRPNIKALF